MQKVQRWSQPFCTCTNTRGRPALKPSSRCGAISLTAMMSATAIFSLASMPKPAIERRARVAPGFAAHLVVIADDAIDLGHFGKHFRLRLRRAAGDDDAQVRPFALQPPDRLPRLRHRLVGDRAAIDDDGIGKPGALRLAGDHFGFERVETAAEGEDVDAHVLRRRWRTAPDRSGLHIRNRPCRSSAHGRRARAIRSQACRRAA